MCSEQLCVQVVLWFLRIIYLFIVPRVCLRCIAEVSTKLCPILCCNNKCLSQGRWDWDGDDRPGTSQSGNPLNFPLAHLSVPFVCHSRLHNSKNTEKATGFMDWELLGNINAKGGKCVFSGTSVRIVFICLSRQMYHKRKRLMNIIRVQTFFPCKGLIYSAVLYHHLPKTIKNTSVNQNVPLGDMFLH